MTMSMVYHRARRLLFLAPLWLSIINIHGAGPKPGDDPFRASRSRISEWEDDAFQGDFDGDGDLSDFELDSMFTTDKDSSSMKSKESFRVDGGLDDDNDELDDDADDFAYESSSRGSLLDDVFEGKETMYEAYNQLHTLAQEYSKPFDAPAVVVVGHQSSGKSALIEALMGFQFNQVGGGTKTRRPVALRMQYNPKCKVPRWYLVGEDGVERPMDLSEIQEFIEKENRRLERDPNRSFDPREINLRMEYKHCPNMILIDTPGLISAPKVPKGRTGSGMALAQQRALQASAREAEKLVVEKMKCEDYIILCVEDTSDWKHGQTREVVQKADPDLSRTVIVNTKFDTKVPQFGNPADIADFLRASILDRISPHKLGGPFFTSVPSGRVGRSHHGRTESEDYMYGSDEAFVNSCKENETTDRASVLQKLNRMKRSNEVSNAALTSRIGLGRLRTFLEQRVDDSYRRNVQKIIPMLQAEYVAAERRLQACEKELEALSVERLKAGAEAFCDEFCVHMKKAIHGSVVAPATIFGETLQQEAAAAGSFHNVQGSPMAVSDRTWDRLVEADVGSTNNRLYGGSQYHRSLREFNLAVKCLRTPSIAEDEIANAVGVGDTHDGVNFLQAACVIALEKARTSFEPMLSTLMMRMTHVMGRLCPVTEYMLRESRDRGKVTNYRQGVAKNGESKLDEIENAMDISQNPQFRELIRTIFENFVQDCADNVMSKCSDDLNAITRYVTWNLDERGGPGALSRALPDQTNIFAVYQVALKTKQQQQSLPAAGDKKTKVRGGNNNNNGVLTPIEDSNALAAIPTGGLASERDYNNLIQLVEESSMTRQTNRTNIVVAGLVQHVVSHWREQFCKAVITKFNCYFMLPFVDDFHRYVRKELQKIYTGEGNSLTDVFDLTAARRALELHRDELISECMANKQLQDKFQVCARLMSRQHDRDAGFNRLSTKPSRSSLDD